MNILLWVFQGLLALHTGIGAVWKFSHNPEQTMPTLKAIPGSVWLAMSVVEILCALCLVAPALNKSLGFLAPIAAIIIALEMLVFCGVHLSVGDSNYGPVMYWLIVAGISGFVAWGRLTSN